MRLSRRAFVVGAAGAGLLAGCGRLPWQAQPRVPRIGFLGSGVPVLPDGTPGDPDFEGFRQGLRDLGYVADQNIVIEYRDPGERLERVREAAAELVALPVDILVAATTPQTRAAKEATSTIPIVFVLHPDPVGEGHVASLARPGGNITGTSFLATPLGAKRLELLHTSLPGVERVAVLSRRTVFELAEVQAAADALGVQLQMLTVRNENMEDLERAFEVALREQSQAFLLMPGGWGKEVPRLREFATANGVPVMGTDIAGSSLLAYGPNFNAIRRRSAYYVDRILKGANPVDLPVEQPMTFDFVVNMRRARELGITFPPEILLQVTEVIQ